MRTRWRWREMLASGTVLLLAAGMVVPAGAADFADPAFKVQWQAGETITPNFWGPPASSKTEQYLYSGTNRTRLVQYFDKGRMERYDGVTNMAGTKVTNGLLATELISGQIQIADDQYLPKVTPPAISIAGDTDNPGPTYATLAGKASNLLAPAEITPGVRIASGITPDGDAMGGVLPANPGTQIGGYDTLTKHNLPQAFVEYRGKVGLTTIGYAKSEPFAATVKVAGKQRDVIIQVFERRVLTYTASNDDPYKVEMGNIGQHYYHWRYELLAATAPAATTAAMPLSTSTKVATPTTTVAPTTTVTAPIATSATPGQGPVMGGNKMCPSGYPIKANATTRQYLLPYQGGYNDADANNCFASTMAVEAAGYTRIASGFTGG